MSPRVYGSCGSMPHTTGIPLPAGAIAHRPRVAPDRGPFAEAVAKARSVRPAPPTETFLLTCIECGETFQAPHKRRRTCGDQCRLKSAQKSAAAATNRRLGGAA